MVYSSMACRLLALCLGCATLMLVGCDAVPISVQPLSNAENSVLDEHLYGQWDVYLDEQEAKPAEPPEKPEVDPEGQPRFFIGKKSDAERTHELLSMQVSETGELETQRMPFFATQLGERKLISLQGSQGEMREYLLMRYEFVNANRLLVYMLNRDFIAAAIKKGDLDGVVKSKTPADDPNAVERREAIRITATAEKLREFLQKHDKAAFDARHAFRLQRASQK